MSRRRTRSATRRPARPTRPARSSRSTRTRRRRPSISSGPAAGSFVSSTSASFGFTDSEGGVSFLCKLDGGAFAACTLSADLQQPGAGQPHLPGRGEGRGRQRLRRDLAAVDGRHRSPPAAPTFTAKPPTSTNSTSANFTFTGEATRPSSASWTAASFAACSSPQNLTGQRRLSTPSRSRPSIRPATSARPSPGPGRSTRRRRRSPSPSRPTTASTARPAGTPTAAAAAARSAAPPATAPGSPRAPSRSSRSRAATTGTAPASALPARSTTPPP